MENAQYYLHALLEYIYSIDEYAKTDINMSYWHRTYLSIRYTELDGSECHIAGWSSLSINEAIFDLIDNFIWEQYGFQYNKSNDEE